MANRIDGETRAQTYRRLTSALNKGVILELELRSRGEDDQADQVAEATERLGAAAGEIRAAITEEWTGRAAALNAASRRLVGDLQKELAAIRRTMDVAERVVKAIGYIDDLVELAAKAVA